MKPRPYSKSNIVQNCIAYLWPGSPDTPYKELLPEAKQRVDDLVICIQKSNIELLEGLLGLRATYGKRTIHYTNGKTREYLREAVPAQTIEDEIKAIKERDKIDGQVRY